MATKTAPGGTVLSWTLFDFANTAYYVVVITLIYPNFFTARIAGGDNAYWGNTIAASMLLTALIGPLFGAIADASSRKKLFLLLFTVACVLATAGLYFTGPGTLALAIGLVIVANMGFEGGTIFYDALLPEIAAPEDYARVSGWGFAMGYLGAFAILLGVFPIVSDNPSDQAVRSTFLIAAAAFALFAVPLFLFVKERKTDQVMTHRNPVREGYGRLIVTIRHIRDYSSVRKFLLAFFVYNDSILTVILFAGIYAKKTLAFSDSDLIYFFLIVEGSALLGSIAFGAITNRYGPRRIIVVTLLIWVAVVVGAFFIEDKRAFWALGVLAGSALGSSQSTSRTMMALLTPADKRTEFFGFYDGFFGKASAVIGPFVYGQVSSRFGDRPAILFIGALLLLGIGLVLRVPDMRHTSIPDTPVAGPS